MPDNQLFLIKHSKFEILRVSTFTQKPRCSLFRSEFKNSSIPKRHTAKIIDGTSIVLDIKSEIKEQYSDFIQRYSNVTVNPGLAVILVGDQKDS